MHPLVDADYNGSIDFEEWCAFYFKERASYGPLYRQIQATFRDRVDANDGGALSFEEFNEVAYDDFEAVVMSSSYTKTRERLLLFKDAKMNLDDLKRQQVIEDDMREAQERLSWSPSTAAAARCPRNNHPFKIL